MATMRALTMMGVPMDIPVYLVRLPRIRLLVAPSRTIATVEASRTRAEVLVS